MRNQNYSGNWFTDMVRDNFWMVAALWSTAPAHAEVVDVVDVDGQDTLEYLFDDSTGNLDNADAHELYSEIDDLDDRLSDIEDWHHDHDDYGYDHDHCDDGYGDHTDFDDI